MRKLSFAELASVIMRKFVDSSEIGDEDLRRITELSVSKFDIGGDETIIDQSLC